MAGVPCYFEEITVVVLVKVYLIDVCFDTSYYQLRLIEPVKGKNTQKC